MNKEYIEISGVRYRVEINWNTYVAVLKEKGTDTMAGLQSFSELKPSDIPIIMAAAINEGERLEGHDVSLTSLDTGCCTPDVMGNFLRIFVSQTTSQASHTGKKKA